MTVAHNSDAGERLRAIRAVRQKTYAEIAHPLGLSTKTVQRWEHHGLPIAPQFHAALCDILDCSPEWLFDPHPMNFDALTRQFETDAAEIKRLREAAAPLIARLAEVEQVKAAAKYAERSDVSLADLRALRAALTPKGA